MNTLPASIGSRLSALLRMGALALALALPHGAAWAQQGPLASSPTVPTPFSWSMFHSGGTNPTALTTTPPFLPPNPLASQSQGTPTGLNGTTLTQIPSFLIGNYDFTSTNLTLGTIDNTTTPPSPAFFANHFRDDSLTYLSWSAPFTFLAANGQSTSGITSDGDTSVQDDDNNTTAFTYPVYVPGNPGGTPPTTTVPASGVDAGWTVSWAGTGTFGTQITAGTASTATNLEYGRQAAVSAPLGTKSSAATGYHTATWTFLAPTVFTAPASAGLYSVVFHLPDPQAPTLATDGTTANPEYPEHRIGDAHYVVRVNGNVVFDTDTLDKNGNIVSRAAISQTETNDPQPLAGPFAIAAGNTLTVTLDNTTTLPIANAGSTYVLADSVSLVPAASAGGGARVDSSPTAINATEYPEIANAFYFGRTNTGADDNTTPFGNATIGTADTSTLGTQHAIRQLVYFGRYEGVVLTDNTGALVDVNGNPVTTPVTRTVGAMYCVNGITGDVVWRFQTSDVLNTSGGIAAPSAPIYTTPAIARLNVNVNGTLETKLCVVFADDNGLVYCVDAIGNRNGTANSTAVAGAYNQPIYSPAAAVNTGGAQDVTPHAHVGNTTAYWVYRPDAARPRLLGGTGTPPPTKTIDPTRDLPVPAAFGLASPTIYVNPNTPVDTTNEVPGYSGTPSATLTPNGIVYIGNSNGTLYSLSAAGAAVTETSATSNIFYSANELYNYVLPINLGGLNASQVSTTPTPLPTPTVNWWFAVNKANTTDSTNVNNVAITSAPSIYQSDTLTNVPGAATTTPAHIIYFATGNETTNVGNVFSVQNTGLVNPSSSSPTAPLTPGSANYNVVARPRWSFPNAYTNTTAVTSTGATNKLIHAALGSISGSPAVFTNPDNTNTTTNTSVYFAADLGPEGYQAERPIPAENGRIWAVDALTGQTRWAYPDTVDPNADNTQDTTTIGGTTINANNPVSGLPMLGTFSNSTPAIGVVQFPAFIGYGTSGTTPYTHTDSVNTTNVTSARVPMLYVGARTEAPDASNFFALDLDGANDNQRNIFYDNVTNASASNPAQVGTTPIGAGFGASPLLVTNPGPTTGGNGGAVFAVGLDNTLNEISATPTTDIGADSIMPQFPLFFIFPGFGAYSSPAIAGFSNTGLATTGTPTIATAFVDTDWVYGGDSTLGVARGVTPGNRDGGSGTVDFGTGGTGPDSLRPGSVPQQLPLHVYLFDNKGTHDPKSTDMSKANPYQGPIGAFEWGEKIYIRVSNVVPPNLPTAANPAGNPALYMADPTDKTVYYTNGQSVQLQLSDVDATGNIVPGRGVDSATVSTNTLTSLADPDSNGFVKENPSASGALDTNFGNMLTDNLGMGGMWLGATTYNIGDGSNGRKNTPGSRRQVISATQVVEAHDTATGKFLQTVTLKVSVNSSANSYTYTDPNGVRHLRRIPKIDQPTFAVLNPIAVRGGGPNIPLGSAPVVNQITNTVGPFSGIDTTNVQTSDLAAYVNGNNVYTDPKYLPVSGVLTGDRGHKRRMFVTTATTDIPHGSIGNNSNPSPTTITQYDRSTPPDPTKFGNYAFEIADRSSLGLNGGQISSLNIQTAAAQWNDNTGSFSGVGAVVNPLPWDDRPTAYRAGSNGSIDYPDIGKQRLSHTLYNQSGNSASVSNNPATLDAASLPASGGTSSTTREIHPDNVDVEVSVPKYQPANLQLLEAMSSGTSTATFQRIAPAGLTSSAQIVYPMGYVANETAYVGTNRNFRPGDGHAYRTFRVFTGVPVDMTMTATNPVIDLGKLPQTFGVQTDNDNVLGQFMPFQYTTTLAVPGAGYQQYFKAVNVQNAGNINLLNVQFDQKLTRYASVTDNNPAQNALPFGSDALDAQAVLSAFDLNGVTGLTSAGTNKYILRTSLDSDLAAYNRNPALVSLNGAAYPGATFHKARVSDATPPSLTVPDVPHDNIVGNTYYLQPTPPPPASMAGQPVLPVLDPSMHLPTSYGPPYIGLAVPLGTPVGAYAQDVRVFEGIDPYNTTAYPDIQGLGSYFYKPLFPPVYGGVVADGSTAPTTTTSSSLTTIGSAVTQPYSNPVRVRASIMETRVSDGATYGNLPQVDAGPAGLNGTTAIAAADFLPVAFRSAYWSGSALNGNADLNLYWTSARNATPATANTPAEPYGLIGERAPFAVTTATQTMPAQGYFAADTATNRWYDPISALAAPATNSFNTAISIAPNQHLLSNGSFNSDGTAYAFVENVQAGGTATAYQNNLYCYAVNTATGSITGTPVPVSGDTRQPKFGARGLKYDNTVAGFKDAFAPNALINDNLWAFWNGGARGRSTLFFSSAPSASVNSYASGGATPFTAFAQALPTPAGLSGVADPTAVLTQTTLASGTVPAIDVTYSGVNADGNTDVYVSRYLPYYVRKADGTTILADVNGKQVVGLALTPSPAITEQLLPDTAHQFYQARDVAWARADTLDVQVTPVGGSLMHILQDTTRTQNADGSYPLYAVIKTSYDVATGTAVYTNIPADPNANPPRNSFTATGGTISITAIYADLVRGRLRLVTSYTGTGAAANGTAFTRAGVPLPDANAVSATFQPQARRITTDRRADTEPVAFLDEAYKPNESPGLSRVSTARYWYIWRKSAAPGTSTTPTLYSKTQRLTLYLHDTNNPSRPVALPLTSAGVPVRLALTDQTTTNPISSANLTANVDVDWARGRLYFPQTIGGIAVEGHKINAMFTYIDNTGATQTTGNVTDTVHWLDELRYNDPAAQPTGDPATTVDTNEHAVPIDVAANEGSPSAFLDPMAYADVAGGAYNPYSSTGGFTSTTGQPNLDQPHKVWLFWNSTRNGTADVFYEAIDPRFSANP